MILMVFNNLDGETIKIDHQDCCGNLIVQPFSILNHFTSFG